MNIEKVNTITYSELPAFAGAILAHMKQYKGRGATILALHGDLGAGKTAFTKALGEILGVTEAIVSPTFTIMKGYETTDDTFSTLIHMDAYRIDDISELRPLQFSEILTQSQTLFVIEWAEKIQAALPQEVVHVSFEIVDETVRTATIS